MKNETKFFYVNLLSMVSDALFRILILSLLSIKYQHKNTEENILGQGISQGKIKRLLMFKYSNDDFFLYEDGFCLNEKNTQFDPTVKMKD